MNLGRKLWIRSLVSVSAEVIPFFWSMRTFIHHNPLYEIESKPFEEAVEEGRRIFGGRPFLRREDYAKLFRKGLIEERYLREGISKFLKDMGFSGDRTLEEAFFNLMTRKPSLRPYKNLYLSHADLEPRKDLVDMFLEDPKEVCRDLIRSIGKDRTLCDLIDRITGSRTATRVDDLVIKSSFEFLDEGQSALGMPGRDKGFFRSWLELARRDIRTKLRTSYCVIEEICRIESPEEVIDKVLTDLKIPEDLWEGYLTLELAKLKGIVGFIRWRSQNREYYWQKVYPVDVVDFTAVRLVLVRGVLENLKGKIPFSPDYGSLKDFLESEPERAYLMWEYFSGSGLPELASELPKWFSKPEGFIDRYTLKKAEATAKSWSVFLKEWVGRVDPELVHLYREFEKREGFIWLEALEETQIKRLIKGVSAAKPAGNEEILADAVFCIDVRSERLRRSLERVGPYRTYGIAGFFGVPMAFVEVSKGHEEFLCPVLIKPRNVVLELPVEGRKGEDVVHIAEKILHDLKANLLTPYITVEAIGLIFGFDFLGKTFFPDTYSTLRSRIDGPREKTRVLVDRLSEEEIERVVDTVLANTVRRILEKETGRSHIPDHTVKEVIDYLMNGRGSPDIPEHILSRLKEEYRIDRGYRDVLRERLKHIGFSHEEQATLIAKALQSIGLTEGFAPVVLIIGHESRSDNNPYESALDCGACGGSSGLHNARVFCEMANNPVVREILRRRHNIDIPPDTVFVPGVHNTTTDEVTLYDIERIPVKVYPLIERIKDDLKEAGRRTAEERITELDEEDGPSRVKVYAHDWSQVRPEWGLSGNYAFVIGRRELTRHLNLRGRVFLHSYDYRKDPKGFLLETILSGPLIVGEWINLEHYFSTTDNEVYGSGSKIYHNVVGRFGVVSGNFSDLRTGLPAQTVLTKEGPHHIPIRLIVLIEAPLDFARPIIERVYKVRELLHNRWINMVIFDPEEGVFFRFREGSWHRYEEVGHGQAQPVRAQEGGDNSQG